MEAPTPDVMPAATLRFRGATVLDPVLAVKNIVTAMETGLQYHETECRTHPYSSHWYTWPVMYHPVLFYYNDRTTAEGRHLVSSITDMGNPALWWMGIPALLFCVWRMTRGPTAWRLGVGGLGVVSLAAMIVLFHAAERPDTETVRVGLSPLFLIAFAGMVLFAALAAASAVMLRRFVPGFIVFGYVISWIMWIPGNARRVLFFYHALGMLTFMALALAYSLTALRRGHARIGGRSVALAPVAYGLAATVVAAFVFFYPIWTAMPLDPADHAMRTWVDTW
ncbi:MAG: hypothetical protein LC685_03580 [Actinobacteria bacterium]|nr:hypothetical protein [Actinomycetota bacterium]